MLRYLVIALAAFAAGIINAIAGGGTLLSFPALMWMGVPPVIANATSTVAIWPGSFSGAIGFRRDLATLPRWLWWLIVPSLLGGMIGAVLLLRTPEKTFERIVPLLILAATLLLAAQEMISKRLRIFSEAHAQATLGWVLFALLFQLLVSIYGGYFGAGMGILMLAALGLMGLRDLHQMNGLKNVLAICINGVAAIYFISRGAVIWSDVLLMAVSSILGGFAGARLAHRLGRKFIRRAVVVIGLVMTVALFVKAR
ncbi:MAG: hypothetical protein JWN02_95 [Acidobacteria bacterium]|nr:hypothetical protein [Acidobacteriota bacterium]